MVLERVFYGSVGIDILHTRAVFSEPENLNPAITKFVLIQEGSKLECLGSGFGS